MDDRLEKALAFSQYRKSIENRKKALTRRFKNMLVVNHTNSTFCADAATIGFVTALLADGHTESILVDDRGNTVQIDDLADLKTNLMSAYFAATNEYSIEMAKLAKARNVKKAMDW
jgi:hypothetical protein